MDKDALRKELFQKYFQTANSILLSDLLSKLSFIPDTWEQMRALCTKNIDYFDSYSTLEKCKIVSYQSKNYLILKMRMWRYVIIDLDKKESITDNIFDEMFFVNNFDELKEQDKHLYTSLYQIEKYEGDIQELVDFYIANQNILSLPTNLYYRLNIENACTWLYIDFINARMQLCFQSSDRVLYEQVFFEYDLNPSGMQDAIHKMGIETMQEIFKKIKYVSIPIDSIPSDLYQHYFVQSNDDFNKKLVIKS